VDLNELKKVLGRLSKPELKKLLLSLDQISFPFKINMSFLKYGNHPITIPKEFYGFLTTHDIAANQDLQILFPDGSTAIGYIYEGKAGWGKYYQIKVKQSSSGTGIGVSQFQQGDRIMVEILKTEGRIKLSRPQGT
jgi:hypothetical protein